MSVRVSPTDENTWTMSVDGESIGDASNMSHSDALDCFAANWPELASELDALRVDDLVGESPQTAGQSRQVARRRVSEPRVGIRRPGSGARFRELMAAGASNAEALAIVRSEFPDSKATLSDAAWNRARLQKEMASRVAGHQWAGDVGELL